MKRRLSLAILITLCMLITVLPLARSSAAQSPLAIDDLKLCSVIRGDGTCTVQPYGAYSPGRRLWARAGLSGFARDGETVNLELVLEIQSPGGQVAYRGTALDGPQTVPVDGRHTYATLAYDVPDDAPAGEYVLRLALHDRLSDARAVAETTFSVGSQESVAVTLPVEMSGRNLAAQITAHGVALANEIAGQPAPQGQLFLIVDTTWRNLLLDQIYGVRIEMLAFVTVDDRLDYPFIDLGRYLEGALPAELYIDPGQRVRGLLAFVVPAEFTSAALRYRDDVIGKGDVVIPLIDIAAGDEIAFPEPGSGDPAAVPVGAGGPVELDEVEPNKSFRNATVLPAAESIVVNGTLTERTDQDWFRLTVNTAEPVLWAFEFSGVPGVDAILSLHAESSTRLVQVDSGGVGEGELLENVRLEAGTYYLLVSSREGSNPDAAYRLVARVTGPVRDGQEFEINSKGLANPFTLGQTVSGRLGFKNDEDWYHLHLDEETSLLITLSPPQSSDLTLVLHQADMRRLELVNLGQEGETERLSMRLAPGDYYACVTGDFDPDRRYALTVMPLRQEGLNQDLEDNNVQAQANPIEDGLIVEGSFQSSEEDWFVIENTTGQDQVVKALIWGAPNAQVAIYAPGGEKISSTGARATFTFALAPPGYTFVQTKGSRSNYQLVAWFDPPAPVDDPRTAAQVGLNTLLPSAVDWQTRSGCFGCHVQSMAVMGGALGRDNGYDVIGAELDVLVDFMHAQQYQDYNYGGSGPLSSMLINGMALAYQEQLVMPGDSDSLNVLAVTAEFLAGEQRSDGRWAQSRSEMPVQQGDLQATADAVQILRRAPGDWSSQIARAAEFLAAAEPETTQDHVYRVIGLVLGDDPTYEAAIYDQVETLWAMQNSDGGWSELAELESSPYATGQVLYALKLAGVSVNDARFNAGVAWLVAHQEWSGEWPPLNSSVHNPQRASCFPSTMWATIGLAGTLETIDVRIIAPEARAPVEGQTTILAEAEARGATPVTRVEFWVDDALLCLDEDAPYECAWDAPIPATAHKIKVLAYDTAGRSGESVLLTSPLEGDGSLQVRLAADAERPVPPNIEIVLDGSGSMMEQFEGQTRIDVAREVLQMLFDELPDDVNVALRAYGHQHYYKEGVCDDTELLVPLGPIDRAGLMAEIDALNPQGKTLIGYTLGRLAADLSAAEGQTVVVLVSDGEETCGSDPCKAADELLASGMDLQVHVIGYAVDNPVIADQLACVAEVTGGTYLPAGSAEQLIAALRAAVTVEYAVYDRDGVEVARGVVDGPAITVPAGTYRVEVLTRVPLVAKGVLVRGDQLVSLEVTADGTIE